MKKIRVGIVNYLNTRPLLYGLEKAPFNDKIELTGDYPALVAERLQKHEIDLGLIPVASLLALEKYTIVGSHCISTEEEAASVAVFSEVPMEQIQRVYLDYQSSTSAALVKILFKKFWNKEVVWELANNDTYLDSINGTTAGLIIGDRALRARERFEFIYDLGKAWKKYTGYPFVFAAWVSATSLPEDFVNEFDQANQLGLENMEEVLWSVPYQVGYDLRHYYTKNMNYRLTDEKQTSIRLFLDELTQLRAANP